MPSGFWAVPEAWVWLVGDRPVFRSLLGGCEGAEARREPFRSSSLPSRFSAIVEGVCPAQEGHEEEEAQGREGTSQHPTEVTPHLWGEGQNHQ